MMNKNVLTTRIETILDFATISKMVIIIILLFITALLLSITLQLNNQQDDFEYIKDAVNNDPHTFRKTHPYETRLDEVRNDLEQELADLDEQVYEVSLKVDSSNHKRYKHLYRKKR